MPQIEPHRMTMNDRIRQNHVLHNLAHLPLNHGQRLSIRPSFEPILDLFPFWMSPAIGLVSDPGSTVLVHSSCPCVHIHRAHIRATDPLAVLLYHGKQRKMRGNHWFTCLLAVDLKWHEKHESCEEQCRSVFQNHSWESKS